MPRPQTGEFGAFYERYINYTTEDDPVRLLENSVQPLKEFLSEIPVEKAGYAYAPGKWTVRQLLQHLIDTERVFGYRAMCIARGEQQPLPGFDENLFAGNATATNRPLDDLAGELLLIRQCTLTLFRNFDETALFRKGIASNNPVTPNAIAFIVIGHCLHHEKILKERYFNIVPSSQA